MNNYKFNPKKSILRQSIKLALALGAFHSIGISTAYAAEEEATEEEKILVTGSRIRRDEFSSASPIQILKTEEAKKSGITSVAQMLQRMSLSNGQQFDETFNSNSGNSNATEAPPTGGVGSSNVGLRGLGPERTLILINGRRLGASGVRGAPAQPDISMIPFEMVERIEVLSDSASAIYGADAVAGVVNIILKDHIDGMQFSATINSPVDDGGQIKQFSFATGLESERSTFVFGAEFYDRERIATGDRIDCMKSRLRDTNTGAIYSYCRSGFWDNAAIPFGDVSTPSPGDWAHFTEGVSDLTNPITGQPITNWSSPLGLPNSPSSFPCWGGCQLDDNGDSFRFYSYDPFYNDQKERMRADLVQPVTRFSVVARGTYLPEWGESTSSELYYETSYFHRHLTNTAAAEQAFVALNAMIPQEDADGNIVRDANGDPILAVNPLNPFGVDALNIITFDDLNQTRDVELDHFRAVAGLRGDISGEWAAQKGWNWDISATYDRGTGVQSQPQLNEDRLALSLDTQRLDVNGNVVCGYTLNVNAGQGFITPSQCVPFQAFHPSLYNNSGSFSGTFATDAEREYLMGERVNTTEVEQTMFQAFVGGELFDFEDGGSASIAIGAEYRRDSIRSRADFLSSHGAHAAENPSTEGATTGSRDITEYYAELNLPILVGVSGADLLEVDIAARATDESNFGSQNTERLRVTYSPVDWVTVSAAYGTSFRAPNLREQFLGDQFDGVSGAADPCHVTNAGAGWDGSTYNAALDRRSATALANCIQQGADPTFLGSLGTTTIPVRIGGNVSDLKPETSEQTTVTLKVAPINDGDVSFDFAITYFDIEIEDTIRSIGAGVIMNNCIFGEANLASSYCSRVTRNTNPVPGTEQLNFPTIVDASFINVGLETSTGWDLNTRLGYNFGDMQLAWNTQLTIQDERTEKVLDDDPVHDLVGEFGTPENRFLNTLSLTHGDFQYTLVSRFVDDTQIGRDADLSADCYTAADSTVLVGNPNVVLVCEAESQWIHDASVTWTPNSDWQLTVGISNLLDEEPPLVNPSAGSNRGGRLVSSGYDQVGQSLFASMTYKF
ncbi:TonB-dependent receptor domain-containing protein [Aliikangiella coralliicola]|nr:TonB-dependent receptor [Aliikangiella coralliicola]